MHPEAVDRVAGDAEKRTPMPLPNSPNALAQALTEGLDRLQIDASPAQHAALLEFLSLLVKWNKVYNLTSVRDPRDMLVVHLLDSLSILALVDAHACNTVLDVGSGAGLPAIPVAIMRPALQVASVDAVAKKIGFQLQVKGALGLHNLLPWHARIEAFAPARRPSVIVSRAYAEIAKMLTSIDRVADAETTVIAMKGTRPEAELGAVDAAWTLKDIVALDVPFLGAERCAVILQRAH